jgi:hypothetical protein
MAAFVGMTCAGVAGRVNPANPVACCMRCARRARPGQVQGMAVHDGVRWQCAEWVADGCGGNDASGHPATVGRVLLGCAPPAGDGSARNLGGGG